jgi:hypothetical protein
VRCDVTKQVWEFTFILVMEGSTKEEALASALDYMAEQPMEYSKAELLEQREEV